MFQKCSRSHMMDGEKLFEKWGEMKHRFHQFSNDIVTGKVEL